jgi:hypothetical protein
MTRSGNVRLLSSGTHFQDTTQHILELARLFRDFANTLTHSHSARNPPPFFGFRDSTVTSPDQAARFQQVFSRRAAALLEGFDQWLASQSHSKRLTSAKDLDKARVGVGIYLVQDSPARPLDARRKRPPPKRRPAAQK